jgi:C4-dicarboxylate-specific signal transduction histidine kinase
MVKTLQLLLVEDNPGDARLIQEMLRDEPEFSLRCVGDVAAALEQCAAEPPDAVLLDLGLPDSEGLSGLEAVLAQCARAPIIVLTGHDDATMALDALKRGAQDYLVKGMVDRQLLVRAIRYARERKRAEEALRESEDRLKRLNRELQEATSQLIQTAKLTVLGELIAGVAHELTQPLNATGIICQSVVRYLGDYTPEALKAELRQILTLVESMRRILDHMRLFVRRATEVERRPLDVNAAIDRALMFVEQQISDHGIELRRQYAPRLPLVIGDAARLEQVFLNLIVNARGALDESAKPSKILEIRTYPDPRPDLDVQVVVEVRDNGVGIPDSLRDKLFQAFVTTKPPGEGTGLGLPIVKKIVEEHKGRIEVESVHGEGAVFRIVLPTRRLTSGPPSALYRGRRSDAPGV